MEEYFTEETRIVTFEPFERIRIWNEQDEQFRLADIEELKQDDMFTVESHLGQKKEVYVAMSGVMWPQNARQYPPADEVIDVRGPNG